MHLWVFFLNLLSNCNKITNVLLTNIKLFQPNASRKYKPIIATQKRPLYFTPVGVYVCMLSLGSWKTRISAVSGVGRPYRLYPKAMQRLTSGNGKRQFFFRVTAVPYQYTLWWRCYSAISKATYIKSKLGYDTVIRLMWVTAAGSNIGFKIATKAL